jgi:hypothetical protein
VVLAIDPGNKESAYVLYDGYKIHGFGKIPCEELLNTIIRTPAYPKELAIEGIASYGMAVGKEVFDTCVWIGRYWQASSAEHKRLVYRMEVKNHLCHSSKANDSNIRQALIDRFGGPQEIKKGGKLYGISKDVWSALAVAVTYLDKITDERKEAEHGA